jgi:hypothetical protein
MAWYNTTMTAWQDRVIACHSHLIGQCGQTTKLTKRRNHKGVLTLEQGLLKSIQSHKDYYSKWSWPIQTIHSL